MPQIPPSVESESSAYLGFAKIVRRRGGRVTLKLRWGRIVAALLALGVAAWFAAAAGLYLFFKHKHGFEEVSYSKMLVLPFRLEEHRVEMGDYHVEEGLKALSEGDFQSAFHLLRVGVARSKANFEGRLALAEIFRLALQRPDWAADILEEGLQYNEYDPRFLQLDYLRPLFVTLASNQYDQRTIELAEELLGKLEPGTSETVFIALAAVRANMFVGDYAEAERILDEFNLTNSPQGQIFLAQIRWNRGQRQRAINILHRALAAYPDQDAIYGSLMRYYIESEEWDLVRRFALLRTLRYPEKVAPRIDLLYALDATGEEGLIIPSVDEIIREFPAEETATPLARFAAETGRIDIGRLAYELAVDNGLDLAQSTLLLQETLLRGGKFQESLDFSDALREEKPAWLEPSRSLESGLRALALQGLGRQLDAKIFVREFMESERIRPQTHALVARLFAEKGATDLATSILQQSYERFPGNPVILSSLIQLNIRSDNSRGFVSNLRDLLNRRVPDADTLRNSAIELSSDRHLFLSDREELLSRIEELLPGSTSS